jgi:hypothetical protein
MRRKAPTPNTGVQRMSRRATADAWSLAHRSFSKMEQR